jgi:hypothetical protein
VEWNFVNSHQEIIDRFGIEYYNRICKIVEDQKNDKRTTEEKMKDTVDFIMNGPDLGSTREEITESILSAYEPNETTLSAIKDAEEGKNMIGPFYTVDEMMKDLNK